MLIIFSHQPVSTFWLAHSSGVILSKGMGMGLEIGMGKETQAPGDEL